MEIKNNIETVETLIKLLKDNELGDLAVSTDKFSISLSNKRETVGMAPQAVQVSATSTSTVAHETVSGNVIKSPIVGTFYAAPSPEKPPFVKVGDKVTKGQVVFIIETMKLMNEITSSFDGEVAEIYVNDGEAVEFDQNIMRIK